MNTQHIQDILNQNPTWVFAFSNTPRRWVDVHPASEAHLLPQLLEKYKKGNYTLALRKPTGTSRGVAKYSSVKEINLTDMNSENTIPLGTTAAAEKKPNTTIPQHDNQSLPLPAMSQLDLHSQWVFQQMSEQNKEIKQDYRELRLKHEALQEKAKQLEQELELKDKNYELEKQGQLSGLEAIADKHPELMSKGIEIFGPTINKIAEKMFGGDNATQQQLPQGQQGIQAQFNKLVKNLDVQGQQQLDFILQVYQANPQELAYAADLYRTQAQELADNTQQASESV